MNFDISVQTDICEMIDYSSSCSRSSSEKDLLTSWDNILNWSESTAKARKLQEEINDLKQALSQLGIKTSSSFIDSESSIKYAIEVLENEKIQLQNYRVNILHLNAAVHGWLTHWERQFKSILMEQKTKELTYDGNSKFVAPDSVKLNIKIEKAEEEFNELENKLNTSENDFQKSMKEEVSEMYSLWDEADARIKTQMEMLVNSLAAWRQFEFGLIEFQQDLGKDRNTLQGLEGELNKGDATQVQLEQNVKIVAKLLSEKFTAVQEYLDPNHIFCIAKFTTSNGSLSDSGISDGGTISDGSLSERDRRLGILRRLAKQLESALAPGSEAMKLIAARMESAETELKYLQNTCRDLIFRTATNHKNTMCPSDNVQSKEKCNGSESLIKAKTNCNKKSQISIKEMYKQKKQAQFETLMNESSESPNWTTKKIDSSKMDNDELEFNLNSLEEDVNNTHKNSWRWRLTKVALPMQLALFTLLCAACLMQPNCCDNLNNFSMSFTPQLRYIRGPPPI